MLAVNVPFKLTVVAESVIVPGVAGAAEQLLTVIVPLPAFAALSPQSFFALTVIPLAAIEPAVAPVIVIEVPVEEPVKPVGNVQT
jgi:hypothetical protein